MTRPPTRTVERCKFDEKRDGNPCNRAKVAPYPGAMPICLVHDRIRCRGHKCGLPLLDGKATHCPNGHDVRLQNRMP